MGTKWIIRYKPGTVHFYNFILLQGGGVFPSSNEEIWVLTCTSTQVKQVLHFDNCYTILHRLTFIQQMSEGMNTFWIICSLHLFSFESRVTCLHKNKQKEKSMYKLIKEVVTFLTSIFLTNGVVEVYFQPLQPQREKIVRRLSQWGRFIVLILSNTQKP